PPVDEEDALQRAIMSDFERAHRIEAQVDLSPYAGEHIAILNGKIVGHGPDLLTLQHECAVANGVPEHRIVTLGVFPPEILVR
ncbi:MAG: DUF5678 domain-containing protein, partial [Gemmataceae bacterium]